MKRIIITMAFLAIGLSSYSQLGVRLGLNSAGAIAQDIETQRRTVPLIGLSWDFKIKDKLHFVPAAMLAEKALLSQELFYANGLYLDVPLVLKYFTGKHTEKGFYLQGGPSINFNLVDLHEELLEEPTASHKVDLALLGGLGYHFGRKFAVGLDFSLGLIDPSKQGSLPEFRYFNQYLYLSYTFGKRNKEITE